MTLKEFRTQSGKSAKEVSELLGVSVTALYLYEQGRRNISLEQVLKLVEVYGVSEREIIEAQLNSCRNVL